MAGNKSYFDEQLFGTKDEKIIAAVKKILLEKMKGALSVIEASRANDLLGVDYWVEMTGHHLGVDAKIRYKDYFFDQGKDDLVLETFSVVEQGKIGWTRDESKRCDYILWYWVPTGRWCLLPFPQLCKVMQENWQTWKKIYKVNRENTECANGKTYQSESVTVPRQVVLDEIENRYGGCPEAFFPENLDAEPGQHWRKYA